MKDAIPGLLESPEVPVTGSVLGLNGDTLDSPSGVDSSCSGEDPSLTTSLITVPSLYFSSLRKYVCRSSLESLVYPTDRGAKESTDLMCRFQ